MNSIYICTLQKKIQTQKSQRCSVAFPNLDTEYAMGTAPIIYSVSRFGKALIFHGAGIWCSHGQNLNLAVG